MTDMSTLSAELRTRVGKGSARAARRRDMIPAVIYGDGKPPVSIQIPKRELDIELNKGRFLTRIFEIAVGGTTERVLPRDVQYHVVKDLPMHLDFLRTTLETEVAVMVPVHFLNEDRCPGLRRGGVLNVVRHEVELSCRADNIPEKITVDLAGLQIGDSVHISAITLPQGVRPTIEDRDFTIATIAAPTVSTGTGDDAAEGDAKEE